MNVDVLVQILVVRMDYVNLRLLAVIILMTVGMEVTRLAVEPAELHSFAARMETVSATLLCATCTTTVETTVMNSDVLLHLEHQHLQPLQDHHQQPLQDHHQAMPCPSGLVLFSGLSSVSDSF